MSKTTSVEGVLCVFEGGELIGILRKNGDNIFYKTEKMSFDEIQQLFD